MAGEPKEPQELSPQEEENKNCEEYRAAKKEYNEIWENIEKVFLSASSREEAERIISEKYASSLDQAFEKMREAHEKWINSILKNSRIETNEEEAEKRQ